MVNERISYIFSERLDFSTKNGLFMHTMLKYYDYLFFRNNLYLKIIADNI